MPSDRYEELEGLPPAGEADTDSRSAQGKQETKENETKNKRASSLALRVMGASSERICLLQSVKPEYDAACDLGRGPVPWQAFGKLEQGIYKAKNDKMAAADRLSARNALKHMGTHSDCAGLRSQHRSWSERINGTRRESWFQA